MSLKLGFGLVTAQVPVAATHTLVEEYADTLAMAQLVEEVDFDSIWVSEHHLAEDSYLPSALTLLAALGAVTKRVELGTGIVLAPFHDPVRFAEDAAVVDLISGGRLILGLAAGWRRREFDVFGIPFGERVSRTERLVDVCRRAWGPVSADDDFSQVTPKPVRAIPLMLGGTATAPIARAGRLGDGYIGSPQNDLAAFRAAVATFDQAAAEAGRDPSTMSLATHVNAWVSDDGEISELVLDSMWNQIGSYARWHSVDKGLAAPGGDLPEMNMDRLRARTVSGTPEEVVEQLAPWVEEFAGREFHLIVRLHYPGMRQADATPAIRLFAQEVAPGLRAIIPASFQAPDPGSGASS